MELRDVLKMMRNELGLSQTEFANALHVNYATVNRWEAGKTYPSQSILAALVQFASSRSVSPECMKNLKESIIITKKTKLSQSKAALYSVEHTSLSQLIENASFPIYVCDLETDELLYANRKTEEMLSATTNRIVGEKCYKCLMHRDSPCTFCHKGELVADKFKTFQAFRPAENTYHLVQGKLIKWNGKKAHVRYIVDVGSTLDKSEKSTREAAYSEQLNIRRELAYDAVAVAHYNLTHNTVSDVFSHQERLVNTLSTHSIDEILKLIRESNFSDENRKTMDGISDRAAMIRQFYAGKTHIVVRFYSKSTGGCLEGTFDLMQNPVTFDIEAFTQLRDVTEAATMEEIAKRIFDIDYETISTINAETGEAHPYLGNHIHDVIANQQAVGDNVMGVEAYLRKYCANDDVESVIKGTSLPYVKEMLETKTFYHITYSLFQNGSTIYKRAVYTYLDNSKTTILCAMQNLTDLHALENEKRNQLADALQTLQEQSGMNFARYNIKTNTFYNNSKLASDVGYGSIVENVPEEFIEKGFVEPTFIEKYRAYYEMLRAGKSGSIIVPCKVKDGSFHWIRIDSRVICDHDGLPYQAVMLFKDIEEEREQAAVYKKWRQSFEQKRPEDYTLFRCNLSKSASFDRVEGSLLKIKFTPELSTFNERTKEYAGQFVHIDDIDKYTKLLNSENLLIGYYSGIHTAALDYRERVGEDEYRWLRLTLEMAQYPSSSDVEIFMMYEPIDKTTENERHDCGLHGSAFENTGIVVVKWDCENKQFSYDPKIAKHLFGKYDNRPLWEILLADGVVDTQDLNVMHNLTSELIQTPEHTSGSMELMMKTPSKAMHWFNFYALKQFDEKTKTSNIIFTFLDVNDDIIANKKLKFQAEHDSLTGLYNRTAFLKLVSDVVSNKPSDSYILLCCDINDFSFFNNRYGREEGDKLLKYVAKKLRSYSHSKHGFSGRLSDDVFAALLPNTTGILDRAKQIIRDYFKGYKTGVNITGRAGVCIISDPSTKADSLLDMASTAKEAIKGKYGAWLAVYDNSMNEKRLREKYITDRMETALFNNQFEVYIQPQFHHGTGQIIGAEALVRWNDPERGLVMPGEFIPVFEKNGFITKMDEYIWNKTAYYISTWMASGNEPVPISVNVSREDTNDPGLCKKLLAITEKYNIPTHLFRLEITESLFAEDPKRLADIVKQLHSAGFLVEMDDFGSGYSSLNVLKDVPVDILKLDMRFLSGNDDFGRGGMIINAVLRMSKWLNIPVIAEGVEEKNQADFLLSIGCSTIQGYLYEKPMPAASFEELFIKNRKIQTGMPSLVQHNKTIDMLWNSNSEDSQVFNNCIGPAAIFEFYDGKYEVIRINSRFQNAMRIDSFDIVLPANDIANICEADKPKLKKAVWDVIYSRDDVKTDIRFKLSDRAEHIVHVTLRTISKNAEHALIFATFDI